MKNVSIYRVSTLRTVFLGVLYLFVILLNGCGVQLIQDAVIESDNNGEECVWVPTYADLSTCFAGSDGVQLNLDYGKVYGMKSSYSGENGHACTIIVYDVLTGETLDIILEEGTNKQYPRLYQVLEDGTIMILVDSENADGGLALLTYDEDGSLESSVTLALPDDLIYLIESVYISDMVLESDGNVAIAMHDRIVIFHEDGTLNFEILDVGTGVKLHLTEDGTVCYPLNIGLEQKLYYIDMEGEGVGECYSIETSYGMKSDASVFVSDDRTYTYMNTDGICAYELESKEVEMIVDWIDVDSMSNTIYDMDMLNDMQIFLLERDANTGATLEGILLTKTPIDEVIQKEELTIAVIQASDDLKERVIAFNKQQTKYRISIEEYVDTTQLSLIDYQANNILYEEARESLLIDLVGSNPPDMIGGVGGTQGFDIDVLAEKGILENLTPYLQAAGYEESDFVTAIYEANKVDGNVYYIPQLFSINTVFANAEYVGNEMGWSLAEALNVVQNLPDGVYYNSNQTKTGMFYALFWYAIEEFVDFETYTCDFDSESFKELLEVANNYPEVEEAGLASASDAFLLNEGMTITYGGFIGDLMDISEVFAVFGDTPLTAIGMPGVSGNGAIYNSSMEGVVMLSQTEHKDIIVQFLLSGIAVDENYDLYSGDGFPILQEQFEEALATQIDPEGFDYEAIVNPFSLYGGQRIVLDEQVLREWDDFGVECAIPTEREIEILLEIITGIEESTSNRTRDIAELVVEDVTPYFAGQKTVDEVIDIIQNRVSLYLAEER
ncbi:MAG: hypothetical protein R3Y47_12185 [Lachnospiraceae bacterium]